MVAPVRAAPARFSNPAVYRFEDGCVPANLNRSRFAEGLSSGDRVLFCHAFQRVSDELNGTNWSPELRAELQEIWQVFINENVKIRPMRRGVSKRIPLAAEPFTRGQGNFDFNASIYIRPKYAKKDSFFLMAMHELRHIYDFYKLWETGSALPEAELEKRGFLIMGRIARETKEKEKFSRLPKVWKDSWTMYAESQIESKMEQTVEKFMGRSSFYKDRMRRPNLYMISFSGRRSSRDRNNQASLKTPKAKPVPSADTVASSKPVANAHTPVEAAVQGPKADAGQTVAAHIPAVVSSKTAAHKGRLPDPVSLQIPGPMAEPETPVSTAAAHGLVKAKNRKSSDDVLSAAIQNEKSLYAGTDNYVYDEVLQFQCWKKRTVTENHLRNRTVARNEAQFPVFTENVTAAATKPFNPSCLPNVEALDTDAGETFWSAAYLDQMPVKFDYFTKLNGLDVARYTVYKPSPDKFDQIAANYPNIKSFRVFFGTIFVSVEDSQIIKFWGSTYPEADMTGNKSGKTLANYNATALRRRLDTGRWVTSTVNTRAVARKGGKSRAFSYVVNYKDYRKAGN